MHRRISRCPRQVMSRGSCCRSQELGERAMREHRGGGWVTARRCLFWSSQSVGQRSAALLGDKGALKSPSAARFEPQKGAKAGVALSSAFATKRRGGWGRCSRGRSEHSEALQGRSASGGLPEESHSFKWSQMVPNGLSGPNLFEGKVWGNLLTF